MSLEILFVGGTGIISSACSALAVEKGLDTIIEAQRRALPS
jgi:hypothetical protein